MSYHRGCKKSKTTGATCGARTVLLRLAVSGSPFGIFKPVVATEMERYQWLSVTKTCCNGNPSQDGD